MTDDEFLQYLIASLPPGEVVGMRATLTGCSWHGCTEEATDMVVLLYPGIPSIITYGMCHGHAERAYAAIHALVATSDGMRH